MRWKDVDFSAQTIRIEQAVYRGTVGSPKTKGSKRILPLPNPLSVALQRHQRISGTLDGLLFAITAQKSFNDTNLLNRHLKLAGKKIGADWLSWHTFRRTHATLVSQTGASPKDAQAQQGHAHISTNMDT